MPQYIKKIRTSSGDLKIDYEALANLPKLGALAPKNKVGKSDLANDALDGYATTEYVDKAVANLDVDLTDYATKDYVDSAVDSCRQYSQGLSYTLYSNGECEVTGIGSCTDKDIIIPPVYNEHRVTGIGVGAFNAREITSITIPDSVTTIGGWAFQDCSGLTSIDIPNSVTTIGNYAFNFCSKLTEITIPNSVTTIGDGAFSSCYNLTSIMIPDSVTTIGENLFVACSSLTIYCEATSKLEGWSDTWNSDNCPVIWGAALDFASVNDKLANTQDVDLSDYYTKQEVDDAVANVSVEVDATLTESGKAADAKATGEALNSIKSTINDLHTTGAEIWFVETDGSIVDVLGQFGANQTTYVEIVDTLPDSLKSSTQTEVYIYIVKDTGICYLNFGNVDMSLGFLLSDGASDYDKGWTDDINAETENGVYCVRVFGDFAEKKDITWENLQDKPFGEVTESLGDTITWDGDLDTFKGIVTNSTSFGTGTVHYVKVSDYVPTVDDIGSNSTFKFVAEGSVNTSTNVNVTEMENVIKLSDGFAFIAIALTDNSTLGDAIFPEKGVYFMHMTTAEGAVASYCSSFTIPNYSFGTKTTIKKIDEKYLPEEAVTEHELFDITSTSSESLGDTVYWNGDLDVENAIFIAEGDYIGTHIKQYGVKVSDSVPTYDEIYNNWSGTHSWGNEFPHENSGLNHIDENDSYIYIYCGSDDEYNVIIIKTATAFNGVDVTPGTYLVHCLATDLETGEDRSHYATSFTIQGYNFLPVTEVKKTIKSEFLPQADTTLTQAGSAADAKAVGDALAQLTELLAKIPIPTAADAGKFLMVDENGNYVLRTIPTLEGVMI